MRNRSLRAARVATSARAVASLISPSLRPRGHVYHPKCPRPTWPAAGQQCLAVTGARIVPWISSWRQSIKPPDGLHRSLGPMPTWHLGSRCRCPVSPGLCAMCVRALRVSVPCLRNRRTAVLGMGKLQLRMGKLQLSRFGIRVWRGTGSSWQQAMFLAAGGIRQGGTAGPRTAGRRFEASLPVHGTCLDSNSCLLVRVHLDLLLDLPI